eukprot:8279907-Alexandrium_andersonii.AAC.1
MLASPEEAGGFRPSPPRPAAIPGREGARRCSAPYVLLQACHRSIMAALGRAGCPDLGAPPGDSDH